MIVQILAAKLGPRNITSNSLIVGPIAAGFLSGDGAFDAESDILAVIVGAAPIATNNLAATLAGIVTTAVAALVVGAAAVSIRRPTLGPSVERLTVEVVRIVRRVLHRPTR